MFRAHLADNLGTLFSVISRVAQRHRKRSYSGTRSGRSDGRNCNFDVFDGGNFSFFGSLDSLFTGLTASFSCRSEAAIFTALYAFTIPPDLLKSLSETFSLLPGFATKTGSSGTVADFSMAYFTCFAVSSG